MNYLNPKHYKWIFKLATGIILLDFFLNIIWLPIAVSKSYGFQDASFVFTGTYNATGAPPVWNWMLSYFVTAGVLVGYEASGHISEETQNASLTAARGIFTSAVASALLGFPVVILYLFCTPDLDTLYAFDAPQPFVGLYALTLGNGGQVVMVIVCILGLVFVRIYSLYDVTTLLTPFRTPPLPAWPLRVLFGQSREMAYFPSRAGSRKCLTRRSPPTPSLSCILLPHSSCAPSCHLLSPLPP